MNRLEELKQEEARLSAELSAVKKEIQEIALANFIELSKFKIGDRILDRAGDEYEITSARVKSWPYFFGRKVLKSGALHKNETQFYSIDNYKLKEAPL